MTADRHVSALTLDALALGVLDPDATARVQAHLSSCAVCRNNQRAAAELREQFVVGVLPRGLRVQPPRRWLWLWLAVPALAVLLIVIALRQRPEPPAMLAVKGDSSWQVFAHRDGQTFAVGDGMALAAGDRIRFAVVPGGARYLIVASVDGGGGTTIYHPYGGERSAPIDGERFELAGSIVLDAAPGPERIYAILSDQPLAAELVTAQLRAVAAGGAAAIRGMRTLPVLARAQLSLVFEKADR